MTCISVARGIAAVFATVVMGSAIASDDLQLKAEISPNNKVSYTLLNVGDRDIAVGIMVCSVWEHWSTDNPQVTLGWTSFDCDRNFCGMNVIPPSKSISGEVPIRANVSAQFRLGFRPCNGDLFKLMMTTSAAKPVDQKIYWSDMLSVANNSLQRR